MHTVKKFQKSINSNIFIPINLKDKQKVNFHFSHYMQSLQVSTKFIQIVALVTNWLSQQIENVHFSKCKGFLALHKQKFRCQKSMR
jgi:hypothetical protein